LVLAAAGATAAVACGGTVVVKGGEGGSGGEGGGGASSSTDVASSSSGQQLVCDVPHESWTWHEYMCLPKIGAPPCPPASDPLVADAAQEQLWAQPCGPCCTPYVASVPCGPDPDASECCYVVEVGEGGCEGRPFTVAGAAVVADPRVRADFKSGVDIVSVPADARARRMIAASWTKSALAEHASIASFARFTLELLALGAPADLVHGAQRAMGDEIVHAELCFGIASVLAGEPLGPGELPVDGALHDRIDPAAIAAATVIEGCVGETLSAALAIAERDAATDPAIAAALDRIAQDEAAHAELAWRSVTWMMRRFGAPVRRAVLRALDESRPFEVDPLALSGVPRAAARACGRLPADEARRVLEAAFDEMVRPCAIALEDPAPVSVSHGLA
jgi:hypothetical protein